MSRSASRSVTAGLVCCLLWAAPALGAEGAQTSFSHRMAQGRFFLDGGLPAQALAEFQRAAETETGRSEPEVHHLLARAAWESGALTVAEDAVRRAWALAGPRPSQELVELHGFLTTRFGKVLVIGAGAADARVPDPAVPLLDPELKRVFEGALRALASPAGGSTSVYLPVGAYRVGGHLVEVTAAGNTTMDLRPSVGMTASGVFGEGGAAPRSRGAAPPAVSHRMIVGGGGSALSQQGSVAGEGRLLVGWEPWFAERFGLRAAFALGVTRLERIQVEEAAPAGFLLGGQLSAGPLLPLPEGGAMGPWLTWQWGWGQPAEDTLPDAYEGPSAYLVHGPDLSLRVVLPPQGALQAAWEVGGSLREYLPQDPERSVDERPHLAGGVTASFTLLIGGAS